MLMRIIFHIENLKLKHLKKLKKDLGDKFGISSKISGGKSL